MVPADRGVIVATIKNSSVVAVLKARERNRWTIDVLQHRLELRTIALGHASARVDTEAGVPPRAQELGALLGDRLALQEGAEDLVAKDLLEYRKVHVVGHRMEDPVAGKDAEGADGVAVRMKIQQGPEGLRRSDHRRHGLLEPRKLQVVPL